MLKHKIVTGLGFGDEGKGTVVDALCARSNYGYVVRYSGGPQAAHNVVDDLGRHHTFSQFGSGTLSYTPTILSRFMMVNPENLRREAVHLSWLMGCDIRDLYANLHISENSLLITPYHIAVNKAVEKARGENAHGSCAQGVGFAMEYSLLKKDRAPRMGHLKEGWKSLAFKMIELQCYVMDTYGIKLDLDPLKVAYDFCQDMVAGRVVSDFDIRDKISSNPCVFEGSQGVLLDQWNGFHPHTTWSTTTDYNAQKLLAEAGVPRSLSEVVGVIRSYGTRHGAGPFPTELKAGGLYDYLMSQEKHNKAEEFQGNWRVGAFDIPMLEYAISCMHRAPDYLAMTFLDLEEPLVCVNQHKPSVAMPYVNTVMTDNNLEERYKKITRPLMGLSFDPKTSYVNQGKVDNIVHSVEEFTKIPVWIKSYGPGRLDKRFSPRVDSGHAQVENEVAMR